MEDITSLVLRVDSSQVRTADRDLDRFTNTGGRTQKATDGLAAGFRRLLGPIMAVVSVTAGLRKLTAITREFDILNAQLVTATGSAEGAAQAFEAIQDFATTTPYDLAQVTDAFRQLVNYGLDPSERALTSYGNTAAAMGKDLGQMVEAVGQAAVGQFRNLRQFGIIARNEGEEIAFTFRGQTERVGNNIREIEEYLIRLGENDFAGAMQERVQTLDGALSNLGDEWNKLWLNISQSGTGDVIERVVRGAISALEELNAMIASGQLIESLDAIVGKFSGIGDDITATLEILTEVFNSAAKAWGGSGEDAAGWLVDAFKNMPENIRAFIQLMGVEIWALVDYASATGKAIWEVFKGTFEFVLSGAKTMGRAIGHALNPFSDATFSDTLADGFGEALDKMRARADAAFSELDRRGEIRRAAREQVIIEILDERDAAIGSFEDQISKAGELRAEYDALAEARRNAEGDRLAEFRVGGVDGVQGDEGPSKADLRALDDVEKIRQQLLTEEEAIQESYERRHRIVTESTLTTEEEKQAILKRLDAQHREDLRQMEIRRWRTALSAFDDFQQNMLVLARTGNKDLARVFKAAAIANTVVKTYESATSAYAALAPIPYVGPALGIAAAAAAVAAGMANVNAIRNQQVGQYAGGGVIPGNSFSGDQLTAGVNSGEMVLNVPQQKRLFDIAEGKEQSGSTKMNAPVVNVYTLPGETAEVGTNDKGELEIYIRKAKEAVAADLMNGNGPVNRGFDAALRRKGVA